MASDSVRLAVHRSGEGPVVVLLHGLGLGAHMWDALAPRLHASGFTALALDFRGHGRSPTRDAEATLDDFADDVLHTLREEGVERFDLVGHSMGGMTAMRLALRGAPIERLALMSTSAEAEPRRNQYEAMADALRTMDVESVADALLAMQFAPGWLEARPDVRARYIRMVCDTTSVGLYRASIAVVRRKNVMERMRDVGIPTLLVAGVNDQAIPVDSARRLGATMPNARLETFAAAHLVHEEHPEVFGRTLIDHLGRRP